MVHEDVCVIICRVSDRKNTVTSTRFVLKKIHTKYQTNYLASKSKQLTCHNSFLERRLLIRQAGLNPRIQQTKRFCLCQRKRGTTRRIS